MNRWHGVRVVVAASLASSAIACRADDHPAADSAQAPADSAATVVPAAEPARRRDTVSTAARADCDEVVASWQRIYDVRVNMTSDTTFEVPSAAADSTRVVGCRVVAEDSVGVPSGDTARLKRDGPARSSYWTRSDDAGWTHLASAPAGSDGSATTYQRALVRCYVEEGSTAVADTSAAKVTARPWFRQTTLCWHHGRTIRSGDTVPSGTARQ